jgi:hypothetical protein
MAKLIAEEEVSAEKIKSLFDQAFFKAEIDADGDIYVEDGVDFPIWVNVDAERRTIKFTTWTSRDPSDGGKQAYTERDSNHLNETVIVASFFVEETEDRRLFGTYYISYRDGIIDSHVVNMARRFANAFVYGVRVLEEQVEEQVEEQKSPEPVH